MNMPAYDYARPYAAGSVARAPQAGKTSRPGFARFASRLALVVVVIAVLGFIVFAQSMVTALQVDIRVLKSDIELEQSQQSRITEKIHTQNNINRIMTEAEALGMGYPDADSILYVVPQVEGEDVMLADR